MDELKILIENLAGLLQGSPLGRVIVQVVIGITCVILAVWKFYPTHERRKKAKLAVIYEKDQFVAESSFLRDHAQLLKAIRADQALDIKDYFDLEIQRHDQTSFHQPQNRTFWQRLFCLYSPHSPSSWIFFVSYWSLLVLAIIFVERFSEQIGYARVLPGVLSIVLLVRYAVTSYDERTQLRGVSGYCGAQPNWRRTLVAFDGPLAAGFHLCAAFAIFGTIEHALIGTHSSLTIAFAYAILAAPFAVIACAQDKIAFAKGCDISPQYWWLWPMAPHLLIGNLWLAAWLKIPLLFGFITTLAMVLFLSLLTAKAVNITRKISSNEM